MDASQSTIKSNIKAFASCLLGTESQLGVILRNHATKLKTTIKTISLGIIRRLILSRCVFKSSYLGNDIVRTIEKNVVKLYNSFYHYLIK